TGSGQSACEGGSLVAYPELEITVSVSWGDMGSTRPVVSSTSLAPEKGVGVATTDSFVAVKVVNAAGAPNPGRTVRVSNGASIRSGMTDASGCAVVQVSPAAAGTDYTVTMDDAGHIDINGVQNPSKSTGTLLRGQLNSAVSFAYDLGGTVAIRLVDPVGNPLSGALPTPTQVTLVASEYSGTSGESARTVSNALTTLPERFWPTNYGAYHGSTPPTSGYVARPLPPGGTVTLDVTFAMAGIEVDGAPAGASIVAVPSGGATTCASPGAQGPFAQGVERQLMPGTWDLFAVGPAAGPSFVCSPGPSGLLLNPGETALVTWTTPTVVVQNAPVGNVWA
ncbi:MAG TPA: hypothetical protein PKB06_11500, partial [Actinotalea sp.]|nr:hypothetical protein [Actinotalea sp.]